MNRHLMRADWTILVTVIAVSVLVSCLCTPVTADPDDKLASLMKDTELKYKVIDESSYLVPFERDGEETLDVFVTYNNEEKKFVLIFTTILDYEDGHEFSPEVLARAMKINNDYPVIKLCLDVENGDIDCQSEAYVRTLDAQSLDMHINFVAGIADEFAEELKAMEEGEAVG